ncbi:hypothetical protein GCM10027053_02920 [Intrasporangium mesophilum]
MSRTSRKAGRRLVVEADGGSRGNPGVAGYGAVVRDAQTGAVLVELAKPLGQQSNNVAEYSGLIAGLQAAAEIDPGAQVQVRMDSKLVVEQMSGRWKIKHEDMRRLASEANELCAGLVEAGGSVGFEWIPRAQNKAADALSNDAMDGKTVRRVHSATTAVAEPSSDAGSRPARPLRLLLVQVPDHAGVADRITTAARRLPLGSARVITTQDEIADRVASELAAALGSEVERSREWAGTAPGEGVDERVLTAYHAVVETGGTVIVVTTRRAVLTVLTDVLGTPRERFWAVATAPGSLTAVEVWEDGSASVAFTNRTDHLA